MFLNSQFFFLKQVAIQIAIPLASIFTGVSKLAYTHYPTPFKDIFVHPILKKENDPTLLKSYSPISIVCIFGKILELLMNVKLCNFISKINAITVTQYAYKKQISIHHAIVRFFNVLVSALNDRKCVSSIMFDGSRAFDSIDRDILSRKFFHYGIRGLCHQWYMSYLTDRNQCVCIDGEISDTSLKCDYGI